MAKSSEKREQMLPFSRPHIAEEEIAEVMQVLQSGWLASGPRVEAFEQKLGEYLTQLHAETAPTTDDERPLQVVALNSGTAALHLAVLGAGLGPGDEVITTPLTWPATSNVILMAGARPVFVDIDRHTLNMRPELIAHAVTERTRAIMPVHFAGLCCDMKALGEIADEYDLEIIEDAAHALGTTCDQGAAGALSLGGCFSFHPSKPITTGEGGALVTRSEEVAERARLLRFHGVTRGARARAEGTVEYEVEAVGFKYNMMDLQAAIGLHQLTKAEQLRAKREALATQYAQLLGDLDGDLLFLPPTGPPEWRHAWHLYVMKINPQRVNLNRPAFRAALRERNVATGLHYLTLHTQPVYQRELGCRDEDFPEALWASERVVSLPLFADMTEDDVAYVAEMVREVVTSHAR
ncbi:MAG: DegT/DnrJ/EryC1/StrS family aminotransferase [Armatimonadota bacterium]